MNLYPPPHNTFQLSPAWSLRILPAALLPALLLILTLGAAPPAQAQTIVNICDRTPAVEASILASVQVRTDDCAEVTDSMLAGITNLNLSYRGITALQAGDFAGLTAMTSLSLNGNSLTTLPAGIFSDLTALNVINLSRNLLTKDLPPTVFSGLTALRTLNLNNNRMSELPAGLFNGLTALRTLNLQNGIGEIRSIRSLPAGIFDDLTALSSLDLSFNRLTTFPAGIFSNLASLNSLKLNKNSLARVPDTAFSGFQGQLNTLQGGSQDPGGEAFYGPIRIDVYLNQVGNTVTATVPAGAFKELKVYLAISSDDAMSTTPTTATITLPVGEITGSLVLSPSGGETLTAGFANIQRPVEHPGLSHTESGGRIQSLRFVLGTNVAGFCDRTAAVRDALLALAQVSNNCYTVTPGQLVGVTTLDLSSQSISALKAGDFAGLTAMTGLNLSGNSLATLPAGVFSGLPALVSLDLGGNQFTDLPNDTFTGLTTALTTLSAGNQTSANTDTNLSLYLSQIGNTVTATLPSAAFAATTANLTVSSDDTNVADITQTISIPVGQTSGSTTLVPTSGDTLTAAFDATTPLTFAGITPTGLSIATPSQELAAGFCSRTTEVQAAIITAIGGSPAETCDTVTSAHLAGIGTLDLSNLGITTLRTGDFAGLTTVTEIDLSDNSGLTALPTNLFADLGTVTTLDLSGSGLSALSADTFSGLTTLQTLDLSDNSITSLLEGAGAFSSLAALLTLHLNDNAIQIVPTGAFNGLAALQTLNLGDNAITSLDATALNPLAALTSLDLSTNKIFRLEANSFSGPILLQTLDLSDNIIYRLEANAFSSLTALQTLDLNTNGISQLFRDHFQRSGRPANPRPQRQHHQRPAGGRLQPPRRPHLPRPVGQQPPRPAQRHLHRLPTLDTTPDLTVFGQPDRRRQRHEGVPVPGPGRQHRDRHPPRRRTREPDPEPECHQQWRRLAHHRHHIHSRRRDLRHPHGVQHPDRRLRRHPPDLHRHPRHPRHSRPHPQRRGHSRRRQSGARLLQPHPRCARWRAGRGQRQRLHSGHRPHAGRHLGRTRPQRCLQRRTDHHLPERWRLRGADRGLHAESAKPGSGHPAIWHLQRPHRPHRSRPQRQQHRHPARRHLHNRLPLNADHTVCG